MCANHRACMRTCVALHTHTHHKTKQVFIFIIACVYLCMCVSLIDGPEQKQNQLYAFLADQRNLIAWGADADAEASEDASGAKKNKEGVLKGVVGVTPVTVESFTAWRAKLEQEEEAAKNMTAEMKERLLRPTGRQLFERDSSLYEDIDIGAEDPSLFEGEELPDSEEEEEEEDDSEDEAGAAVEDASLFKDLGDEDLPSDSDEDDPDYKP